jgi:hypothetical protein
LFHVKHLLAKTEAAEQAVEDIFSALTAAQMIKGDKRQAKAFSEEEEIVTGNRAKR